MHAVPDVNISSSKLGLTVEFPNLGIPTELAKFCSVISRKKWLIPVHSNLYGIAISELWNGTERKSDGIMSFERNKHKTWKQNLKKGLFFITIFPPVT